MGNLEGFRLLEFLREKEEEDEEGEGEEEGENAYLGSFFFDPEDINTRTPMS